MIAKDDLVVRRRLPRRVGRGFAVDSGQFVLADLAEQVARFGVELVTGAELLAGTHQVRAGSVAVVERVGRVAEAEVDLPADAIVGRQGERLGEQGHRLVGSILIDLHAGEFAEGPGAFVVGEAGGFEEVAKLASRRGGAAVVDEHFGVAASHRRRGRRVAEFHGHACRGSPALHRRIDLTQRLQRAGVAIGDERIVVRTKL